MSMRWSRVSGFQSTRLREARRVLVVGFGLFVGFQSTRLREARPVDFLLLVVSFPFQSTRLREARRPRAVHAARSEKRFNPRAYVRRDMHSRQA